ncbi:hypothetical protein PQJ75_08280 [Rhodoplanes sp. TEM]|uniref:Uncharacterized protein n=1 Tax=Rhodoplanes tepidamans TaxID=200616 RepID=A0ABT5JAU6_RHOTP|nr:MULTISPECIES: hypothetical protein [Rhodoplanes]MDC7786717.1 hypothetical protein [Rhodoplanes tepidamans]MDC7983723.1 hypothetical protein [Rhodoplanes sp. TEM]MDQ0358153.1 hypothetical protein [Rhodoplanes tepidamans]
MDPLKQVRVAVLGLAVAATLAGVTVAAGQLAPMPRPKVVAERDGIASKDSIGRICLDVETIARGRAVNPNLFDHIVSVENRCPKVIKVRVCLHRTERCTRVEVPGLTRRDAVIGIGTGTEITRYVYSEQR